MHRQWKDTGILLQKCEILDFILVHWKVHCQTIVGVSKSISSPCHQWGIDLKTLDSDQLALLSELYKKSYFSFLSSLRNEAQQIYQDQCSDCILKDIFSADPKTIVQLGVAGIQPLHWRIGGRSDWDDNKSWHQGSSPPPSLFSDDFNCDDYGFETSCTFTVMTMTMTMMTIMMMMMMAVMSSPHQTHSPCFFPLALIEAVFRGKVWMSERQDLTEV